MTKVGEHQQKKEEIMRKKAHTDDDSKKSFPDCKMKEKLFISMYLNISVESIDF